MPSQLLLEKHHCLGTVFSIECFGSGLSVEKREEIGADIIQSIASFEAKFSRFKEGSLVTMLSRAGRVPYDEDLAQMLLFGMALEEKTKGVFSLFYGNRLTEKGYGFQIPSHEVATSRKEKPSLLIDEKEIVLQGGEGVDLGGIGKGYLIDLLAKRLSEGWGIKEFLINGGGDIYATEERGSPIKILLEHPLREGVFIGSISLFHQGFGASSSFKRAWHKEGKEVNHFIIQGEEVWGAVFTVGKTALLADAFTKCVLLTQDQTIRNSLAEDVSELKGSEFFLIEGDSIFISPGFPPISPAE